MTTPQHLDDHQCIFICGLHRSGTSILFRSLRDHPRISGFKDTGSPEDEGIHLQSVYPKPTGYHGGGGCFGFEPREHLTEESPLLTPGNRQQLRAQWGRYWDLGKPFLLEKSPPHLLKTRFLQSVFPRSSFVVVLRHPLAVSYATRQWYRYGKIYWIRLAKVLAHWLHCHDLFARDRPFLRNVFILHYELFVQNPELWLDRICDFLKLEHFSLRQPVRTGINQKYFALWQRDRASLVWRYPMGRMVRSYEHRIRRYGYSLEDLDYLQPVDDLGAHAGGNG